MDSNTLAKCNQLLTGRWIDFSMLALAAFAWGATVLQSVRKVTELSLASEFAVFAVALVFFSALIWLLRRHRLQLFYSRSTPVRGNALVLPLTIGIFLRIAWVVSFTALPTSDGATYLSLANSLSRGEPYYVAGSFAFWPPGYPFFLAPWLLIFPASFAVPLSQIVLFSVSALGVFRLAEKNASQEAAKISVLLLAVWPNLIALSATPEKEMLVLALLPWAMHWMLGNSTRLLLCAGLALGASVLVQPSLQLAIPAIALLLIIRNGFRFIPGSIVFIIGATLVIAPWTVRNYYVLGEFKLISTNGGNVLYRANNPLANGGYTERGEVDLSHLGELELDRQSKDLALRWIRDNPMRFLALAIEKQVRFMGDDSVGVYSTFRAEGEKRDNRLYVPLKLFANFFWLCAWLLLAKLIADGNRLPENIRILIWAWFYLFSLHSIFESQGKYHVPVIWVLCIAIGVLCSYSSDRNFRKQNGEYK